MLTRHQYAGSALIRRKSAALNSKRESAYGSAQKVPIAGTYPAPSRVTVTVSFTGKLSQPASAPTHLPKNPYREHLLRIPRLYHFKGSGPLRNALAASKASPANVRRLVYRPVHPGAERAELVAEYQRLTDLRLRGEITGADEFKLNSLDDELDRLDLQNARASGALREYRKDINALDELMNIGERLKRLL